MFFTFDYDYSSESWNLPRDTVPSPLQQQGVPHALWVHFWDSAQSVVERVAVRSIMMKKEANTTSNSGNKKNKLDEQTSRDLESLQKQAERLFPNVHCHIPHKDHFHSTMSAGGNPKLCLELAVVNHAKATPEHTVNLHYDANKASWNLDREQVPSQLKQEGVSLVDWMAIWDYGFGVNQRAREREHLNQLHERELQLCQKSLSYMNSTHIPSVDKAASQTNTTAAQLRHKMEKLRRAQEANANNTKKGWQELQRRASHRFEPYGIKVYLYHPNSNNDNHTKKHSHSQSHNQEPCCGLQFVCPTNQAAAVMDPILMRRKAASTANSNSMKTSSSIWLGHSPSQNAYKDEPFLPISSVWSITADRPRLGTPSISRSSESPSPPPMPPQREKPQPPKQSPERRSWSPPVLRPRENQKAHAPPPKPEEVRKQTVVETSTNSSTADGSRGHPVVLTYVHDEIPSRIEVTTPLSNGTSGGDGDSSPSFHNDSFEEDSHGYVVPPAPTSPPSSIGSSSSGGSSMNAVQAKLQALRSSLVGQSKKLHKSVRFGQHQVNEYENPYTKEDRKTLWFTHEDREECRNRSKILCQRVIDNKNKGGSNNVVFMDSETEEEVCWRGLEHAKKGNLSARQETRRAFLTKVLEKQRSLRFDSFSSRRGMVTDLEGELQVFASRASRHCRERAQKMAAQDAKEARAIYKESLRKTNLHSVSSIGNSRSRSTTSTVSMTLTSATSCTSGGNSLCRASSSTSSSSKHHQHRSPNESENEMYHQNDIFQDYCRQMHLASKARLQQAVA